MSATETRNPVFIVRFVLFSFLIYLNLLAIGFAAWNISSIEHTPGSVPGAPTFVIINACLLFLFLTVAFAELVAPQARTALVAFECGWTSMFSVLQFGAAVDITINGPPLLCSGHASAAACASATLLVPLTWLSATILLLYFFGLVTMTVTHLGPAPNIWFMSIYSAPWFAEFQSYNPSAPPATSSSQSSVRWRMPSPAPASVPSIHFPQPPPAPAPPPKRYNREDYWYDMPETPSPVAPSPLRRTDTQETTRPGWARSVRIRRGIDPPFITAPRLTRVFKSVWSASTDAPIPPPKMRLSYGHFPQSVEDEDAPIAQRRLSQWVPAEFPARPPMTPKQFMEMRPNAV